MPSQSELTAFESTVIDLLAENNKVVKENNVLMRENKLLLIDISEKLRKIVLNTN